jgi:hypothetical protein
VTRERHSHVSGAAAGDITTRPYDGRSTPPPGIN